LTPRTRGFFPASDAKIVPVRLVDGRTGEAMTGWMVPDGGYVFGLGEWYAKNELPAGAYISLQRAADPAETIVDFQSRRMRREWVRVAHADGDELTFQMTKYPISCEYDETMLLAEDNPEEVDGLWAAEEERNRPALGVLLDIFPELAKLNPRVHAKTLYAAFNVLRRCPPGPIFHQLSVHPSFEDVGNGYWTFDVTKAEKP
jgi:hypothetical protein